MTKFIKDPQAIEWFGIDWTDRLAGELPLVEPDTVDTSTWTAPAGLTVAATMLTDYVTGVKLGGGTVGQTYRVVNEITTAVNEETLQATISIQIMHE